MSFIDKIKYGTLPLEYKNLADKNDAVSQKLKSIDMYRDLFEMQPPNNSSEKTLAELKECVRMINAASDKILKFCLEAEQDHLQLFISALEKHGIHDTTKADLQKVVEELDPLDFRLKDFYNRPRPYQLAYHYKLKLHIPIKTTGTDSPAYPSGHALEGYVLSHLLAAKYPKHKDELIKLGKNIGLSRLHIGVHYKSDYDFGVWIGKLIINNKLIKL
jgi:hypothetical protein